VILAVHAYATTTDGRLPGLDHLDGACTEGTLFYLDFCRISRQQALFNQLPPGFPWASASAWWSAQRVFLAVERVQQHGDQDLPLPPPTPHPPLAGLAIERRGLQLCGQLTWSFGRVACSGQHLLRAGLHDRQHPPTGLPTRRPFTEKYAPPDRSRRKSVPERLVVSLPRQAISQRPPCSATMGALIGATCPDRRGVLTRARAAITSRDAAHRSPGPYWDHTQALHGSGSNTAFMDGSVRSNPPPLSTPTSWGNFVDPPRTAWPRPAAPFDAVPVNQHPLPEGGLWLRNSVGQKWGGVRHDSFA